MRSGKIPRQFGMSFQVPGCVQASCIAKEVIKHNGDNSFLGMQGRISTGIWRDFNEMAKGLCCKDNNTMGDPTS
jgi:hypothetical protein